VPQIGTEPLRGQVEPREHFVESRLTLIIEDPGREHLAIRPTRGQKLQPFARRQRSAAGGVEITVDQGKEEAHGGF
jgi:hypothetical protein